MRGGQSRVLVVRGDAGVGKSALLQHLVDAAAGFRVVRATGVESEMELPFAALHQLCMSMFDRLETLPGPQRDAAATAFGLASGNPPDRLLIGLAVLTLFSTVSEDGPLLCVVDDAHWLDRESAQVLMFVGRRLHADRVGLVLSTRDPTADLGVFPELAVEGLQDDEARALLTRVLHVRLDDRVRDRIVAETCGNPLALVEWPRGRTPVELAGGFGMPALSMRGQIEENFRGKVAELPEPAQRFLTVAAAEPTGDPVLVWRAASLLGAGRQDATPAIEAGLVEIGVRTSFRHPLVRTAAYNAATLGDRRAAHRALAEAIDSDEEPDRHAWHRALGSAGPDEDVAAALARSADRARARGGLAAAGALLERSVALTLDPSRRRQRILAAAAAHLEAGSFETAAGLLALADATPLDAMSRAHVELLRARLAMFGGDMRDGPGRLLRAAQLLETLDPALAVAAHVLAMAAASIVGDLGNGVGLVETCEAAMACPLPPARTAKEWILVGLAQRSVEGPAAAAPALRHALEAPIDDTPVAEAMQWRAHQIGVAMLLWDIDAAHGLADLSLTTTRDLGALSMLPVALDSLAHVLVLEGDLDGAGSALAEATQITEATGSSLSFTSVVALHAGLRGKEGAARQIEHQMTTARATGSELNLASALWASAILHNGLGQYDRALAVAVEAIRTSWRQGEIYFHELIEAAARSGQPDVARSTLERLEETTDASGTDWAIGIQRRSEALLSDGGTAEDLYRDAIGHLSRTPVRSELARAHLLYGEWLRRENRRVDARAQLRVAYDMFTRMGIHGFAERARHELLATGQTVRKRTVESFDELTPQEAHIGRLAADGRTNPEIGAQLFISPRTVEWHLRKVFTKLGVASRRDLREALPSQAG